MRTEPHTHLMNFDTIAGFHSKTIKEEAQEIMFLP